jgi:hypothetical protein
MTQSKLTQVFGISPEELKESILIDVRAEFQKLSYYSQPVEPPEYLSRKETAKILQVSLVTLSAWNKKKILNPYRLGNLIRYKRKEIDQALISINPLKK